MDVTAVQQLVIDDEGGRLVVVGGPGSGRTTSLIGRYVRLARGLPASRLLVVCRSRPAAQAFTDAVLPHLRGGFDALPVTTVYGLAHDLVTRSVGPVRILSRAEQAAAVRRLLAEEQADDWPVLGHLLGRPAFADEVVDGLDELRRREVAGVAGARAGGPAWQELARFAGRYDLHLVAVGATDLEGLLASAAAVAADHRGRFDHVLVDDADALPAAGAALLAALVGDVVQFGVTTSPGAEPAWATAGARVVTLPRPLRAGPPGTLVRCVHPSVEGEAIAGLLHEAHERGVPWSAMAVLVRRPGGRQRSIGRALARHGVPVVANSAPSVDEPVVRAVVDMLRWVDGDELALDRLLVSPLARLGPLEVRAMRRTAATAGRVEDDARAARLVTLRDDLRNRLAHGATPAELAYEVWAQGLAAADAGSGAVDDRALDALVALIDGLARAEARPGPTRLSDALAALAEGDVRPDPWRPAASAGTDGVCVLPIEAAAGREWHTVVVAGCVEGELPNLRTRRPLFDPAELDATGPDGPGSGAGREADALAAERRLFAIATSRATTTLLATAAPQPGVLLSRFVEAWPAPAEPVRLPLAPGHPAPARAATAGPAPAAPDGHLLLSATQLDTYDDCPLRYAYQYVLRARDEPGVHAGLGTLVHDVLAEFLDPAAENRPERTLDGLLHLADRHWRDDIARYRPQAEEARRDFVAMLTNWWEAEGSRPELESSVVAVERPFDIAVGPHRLVGKIDRIDRTDDGAGLRVIDYKTGKSEPRASDVAEDLQLAVYHLAATRDPGLAELGPPTQLELRYLRSMHTYRQPVVDGHAARTEERVLAVAERILAEDFEPAVDANCRTCSFHRLCPLQPEGRQVGVGA